MSDATIPVGALGGAARRSDDAAEDSGWAGPGGLVGWLATVDHKRIGRRYIVTAFLFFAAGGVLAALMRLQLARSRQHGFSVPIATTRSSRCTARR